VKGMFKTDVKYAFLLARLLQPLHIMVRYCSWCGRIMGFRKGGTGVTHGICRQCYLYEQRKHGKIDKTYLVDVSPTRLGQSEEVVNQRCNGR